MVREAKNGKKEETDVRIDEVTSIMNRMKNMSISDPQYGMLYYKIHSIDPLACTLVRQPQLDIPNINLNGIDKTAGGHLAPRRAPLDQLMTAPASGVDRWAIV